MTLRKREEANLSAGSSEIDRKFTSICGNKESTCVLSKPPTVYTYKKYLCVPDFVGQRESILHIARYVPLWKITVSSSNFPVRPRFPRLRDDSHDVMLAA